MRHFQSWGQLQTFLGVARQKSYRATAHMMGLTSTTVARHIETINAEVGRPVFRPHGNEWVLTQAGQDLLQIAESAETSLGFMLKALDQSSGNIDSVTINTSSFIISDFLAPALEGWRSKNPDATIVLEASDQNTAIERGEADVALRLGRPEAPGTTRFKLATFAIGVYAPKGKQAPGWVGLPAAYSDLPEMRMARAFFGATPQLQLDSFRAIARASLATGLSCILPTCIARHYQDLERITDNSKPLSAERELWFLFYETRKTDPAIVATRNWLRDVFPAQNRCLCGACAPA